MLRLRVLTTLSPAPRTVWITSTLSVLTILDLGFLCMDSHIPLNYMGPCVWRAFVSNVSRLQSTPTKTSRTSSYPTCTHSSSNSMNSTPSSNAPGYQTRTDSPFLEKTTQHRAKNWTRRSMPSSQDFRYLRYPNDRSSMACVENADFRLRLARWGVRPINFIVLDPQCDPLVWWSCRTLSTGAEWNDVPRT